MRLGEIIRNYREENGMSMSEFAKAAGISKAYIGFLEKGSNPQTGKEIAPSIKIIHSIAQAMHMDFDELFNTIDGYVTVNQREGRGDTQIDISPTHTMLHAAIDQMSDDQAAVLYQFLQQWKSTEEKL